MSERSPTATSETPAPEGDGPAASRPEGSGSGELFAGLREQLAGRGSDELLVEVERVGKYYRLYDKPQDRLKGLLMAPFGRTYGKKFWALRDVSLHVAKGEAVGVVGRNGSGKSTLLQIIAGTLRASSGDVRTRGRIAALLELGSGFNPEYTGRENVYMNASILGLDRAAMDARLDDVLSFADIGPFVDQPVKTYSSGMFVRLAFAVAVNVDPDVLIVDEALSVGDISFQAKCFRKIREFRDRGVSMLMVTHDLSALTRFCHRAVVLDGGRVCGSGSAKAMVDLYKQIVTPPVAAGAPSVAAGSTEDDTRNADAPAVLLRERHELNRNALEYGSKDMEIVDFGLADDAGNPVAIFSGGDRLTLTVRARVNRPVKHPILAWTIKDLRGTEITGTNTLYDEEELGVSEPGDEVTVKWEFSPALQKGQYALSLGCTEFVEEGLAVHHRLYDVLPIESLATRKFVGMLDPMSSVSVLRPPRAKAGGKPGR